MDNYYIADQFSMLAKLMDIHGENSFKSKSYGVAAFNIEKLTVQLAEVPREKINDLKGIGDSVGKKVIEILDHGHLKTLEEYVLKTPAGVLEMMNIKGLGPKKIATIWKEMEIESLGELLYACNENRLARFKGFGEKTQKNVQDSISFYMKSQGCHLYATVEQYGLDLIKVLKKAFSKYLLEYTGQFRRQSETIDKLEFVTTIPTEDLQEYLVSKNFEPDEVLTQSASFKGSENVLLQFYFADKNTFYARLFETSCSEEFLTEWNNTIGPVTVPAASEEQFFKAAGLNMIPAFLREKPAIIKRVTKEGFDALIQPDDIRGIVHSHSTWSDGSDSIERMAEACIKQNLEYLVISDHSKSAFYANGLFEDRILAQQDEINKLNQTLKPFKIFKSIECDILNDGSLDYSNDVLSTFDLVIASVHSNLKMTEEKANARLLGAISNPYTTILGHMTTRLLLSRPGYPLDFKMIIDACRDHHVVIELNANPRRLDMDWRYIDYALEQGVLISIDPDAHDIAEFKVCKYGVLMAQKAAVKPQQNLSSFSLTEFENYLASTKKRKNIGA